MSLALLEYLLDESEHFVLIKMAFAQVSLVPVAHLQLTTLLCRCRVNASRSQAPQVFLIQPGINNVESPLTAIKSFLDEWKHYPILFVKTVKERADVTLRAQH